jgi:diacylglycerol kinase (ATP)
MSSSSQSTAANQVLILHNANAGAKDARKDVDRLIKQLQQRDFDVKLFTDLELAAQHANTLFNAGKLRVFVGVGGDGTAMELVNRTREGTPLTLLPRGNSNLLARHLHLESSPDSLVDTIAQGVTVRLDTGRAAGRIFLLMASCGLDAEVVELVHIRRTGHIRSRDYLKPLWETLRTYKYPELRVYWDEAVDSGVEEPCLNASWFSVFNLPCYGGGLRFAPHAVGNDAQLDLCGFRQGNFWNFLRYLSAVYLRQHHHMKDWITRSVRRLRIVSDSPVPYQLDGDPGGWLPLDIEVLPNRLTMLVPNKPSTIYHNSRNNGQ